MSTILTPDYAPETMPEWSEEDFDGTRPFEWLYERREDSFALTRWVDKASAQARKYGIRNFKKQWDEYLKTQLRHGKVKLENASDYEGQPLELSCGDYICNDYVGVQGIDSYGNEVTVCAHPIMPTKRLINVDSGEVQLEIAYRRGNVWRRQIVPRSMLATASQIVGLSAWGIGVDSENAKALVKYFTAVEHLNYTDIPERNSTKRLGWVGDGMFSPYMDELEYDGDPTERKIYDAVCEKGSYELWRDCMTNARSNSKAFQIVLATSFASAMVKPCRCLPFIVHLWGGTEAGKTVALMAAISVWGNPEQNAGLFRTFNSTDVGIEIAASVSNSIPLFIDELQIAKDRKSFDEFIYKIAEGAGRTRGAKTGGLKALTSWANTTITTGEQPITNGNSGAGAINRSIEIDCKNIKLLQKPRDTVGVILSNYGHAGRKFVSKLQDNFDYAIKLQGDYQHLFAETNVTDKQALSASLILAADRLASEWVFGNAADCLTIDDILPYMSTKEDVDINLRALDWLYGFVAANANRFYRSAADVDMVGEIWGEYDDDRITIIKSVFDRCMADAGFSPAAFLSWAKRQDLLEVSTDRERCVKKKRIHRGVPTWCVVIKIAKDVELTDSSQSLCEDLPV